MCWHQHHADRAEAVDSCCVLTVCESQKPFCLEGPRHSSACSVAWRNQEGQMRPHVMLCMAALAC